MRLRTIYRFAWALLATASTTAAIAQERAPAASDASAEQNVLAEDIVVTATKKVGGERVLAVPPAVTAYGAPQLAAKVFNSLMAICATTTTHPLHTSPTPPPQAH